jgi:hypothetical protein
MDPHETEDPPLTNATRGRTVRGIVGHLITSDLSKERSTMQKRAPGKTPKAAKATPKTPKAKAAPTPKADPLAGVTIRAEVLTYKLDLHRPRVHITTPTARYYKLVPGVRTATKAEALTAAQAYRETILTSGELPAPGVRKVAKAKAEPLTVVDLPGVTRIVVD